MVMTTLSGVELLGILTSNTPFEGHGGKERFVEFWRRYLYTRDAARQELADVIYRFVRNGLAHAFMTQAGIVVSKGHCGDHLRPMGGVVASTSDTRAPNSPSLNATYAANVPGMPRPDEDADGAE